MEPLLQDWERWLFITCIEANRIKQDKEQRNMFQKEREEEQDKNSEKNFNKREISNLSDKKV